MRPPASDRLARGLGPIEAVTLLVGGTIGASIFLVPSAVANEAGSPGLALLTWGLTGLLAICGALSFAELAAAIPETGGTYQFLRRAYPGTPAGFLFVWMMTFAYATGATAVTASMGAIYAGHFLGHVVPWGPAVIKGVAVGIILTFTLINYAGIRQGGRTQNALTVLKVGAILAIVAVCLLAPGGDAARFQPLVPADRTGPGIASGVGTAMILSIFSYSGWHFVANVAGEIRDPARNLPRAILGGIGVVILLYLALNAAYIYVLPFDRLQQSERVAADAMQAVVGRGGADLAALAVLLSALGSSNAQLLNYPRLPFSLARDGLFWAPAGRIHPGLGTPATAILLIGGVASLFALVGTYQQILTFVAFVGQFFMALVVAGLFVLRWREPSLPRPYRAWGYPVTPLIYLAILAWYLVNLLLTRLGPSLVGVAIVLAGLPFYWRWRRRAVPPPA